MAGLFDGDLYEYGDWGRILCRRGGRSGRGRRRQRLETATYAEFNSTGPGANAKAREPDSKQLTAEEAKKYETKAYLAGADGWDPTKVK